MYPLSQKGQSGGLFDKKGEGDVKVDMLSLGFKGERNMNYTR